MPALTLYGRAYCHLCDDMKVALESLRRDFSFVLHEVDVDSDASLEDRFGDLVPVLMAGTPEALHSGAAQLCHYFLDEGVVRVWLAAHGGARNIR
ncbi:thioredoxin family protein [Cupriavidus sp. TA19]|uniref:glutaredoxin family protein n=1 Tax=unclassified Cupriavidus TaxID=2640874 RepID=UPI000E2FB2C1|nr:MULTISPECIES: glutaredoxin family protein [unclassified Cupriavidus]BDB24867.1 glutaredoxin family protein [Cupriavidus sp. P-10]GLC90889.1 thioredoxin family protein [Cupriavidus sp. TA19]